MCFSLEEWKDVFTIIGIFIGGFSILLASIQYKHLVRQKKAEHFFSLRDKYNKNAVYCQARAIIDNNGDFDSFFHDKIKNDIDGIRSLFGFYEEIAILVNSEMINKEIAFYMFGYYVTEFMKKDAVINYLNQDKEYWEILFKFEDQMKSFKEKINNFDYSKVKF